MEPAAGRRGRHAGLCHGPGAGYLAELSQFCAIHISPNDDPAAVDPAGARRSGRTGAHHSYYKEITDIFLEIDRKGTIELLRRVMAGFSMPAIHVFADTRS